jgi:hypothetical protein
MIGLRSVLSCAFLVLVCTTVFADEVDPVASELGKSKTAYSKSVDAARKELLRRLESKIDEVAKTGKTADFQRLEAERKQFEADETKLPSSALVGRDVAEYRRSLKKAQDALIVAYEKAVVLYTNQKANDKIKAVQTELQIFQKQISPVKAAEQPKVAGKTKLETLLPVDSRWEGYQKWTNTAINRATCELVIVSNDGKEAIGKASSENGHVTEVKIVLRGADAELTVNKVLKWYRGADLTKPQRLHGAYRAAGKIDGKTIDMKFRWPQPENVGGLWVGELKLTLKK